MSALSVSNIAWNLDEEEEIAALLFAAGVRAIDLAPGKYFSDLAHASEGQVEQVRSLWERRGFSIIGLQALLFGTQGLNLFHDSDGAMFDRLASVCRVGAGLGAGALTFGSPRQRDRSGLDDARAASVATDFFRRLGDVAATLGTTVCVEPNPAAYGCNFLTRSAETAAFVRQVAHPAIRMQLDVGAIAMNGEDAESVIAEAADVIGHVHASEPMLATLGDAGAPHEAAGRALAAHRPDLAVTIEMATAKDEPNAAAVSRAVALALRCYGAAA